MSTDRVTPQAGETRLFLSLIDRERSERLADYLAIALAVSLPWSTSATGILAALWFLALLPTLNWPALRPILLSPAGWLPVAFTLLALLGVLWSQAPMGDRLNSVVPFARMLVVPLLLFHFSRSSRGVLVIYGFFISSTALLITSYLSFYLSETRFAIPTKHPGVPVKDTIVQASMFTLCAFGLLGLGWQRWLEGKQRIALICLALALAFLCNMVMVSTSRTAWLVIAALLPIFALRMGNLKAAVALLTAAGILAVIAWNTSAYLRLRIGGVYTELVEYRTMQKQTSSGQRLEMWSTSLKIMADAPIIGYGTGALVSTFTNATRDNLIIPSAGNPHNQTFAIGIQLGIIGIAVLYALWLSHLLLFRGTDWVDWFGIAVVVHIVVGSLSNSYLFDFTPGWTYAVCTGVAGGIVMRRRASAAVTSTGAS